MEIRVGRSDFRPNRIAENESPCTSVASATNWLLRPPGASAYSSSAEWPVVRRIALDAGSFSIRHGNGAIVAGAGGTGARAGAAVLEVRGADGATTKFETSQGIGGSPGAAGS